MDLAADEFALRGPPELSTFVQLKAEEQIDEDDETAEGEQVEQEHESDETAEEEQEESVAPGVLMGRTENNSATFLKSGSACLDFFFQIVPDTPASRVTTLLKKAWEEDALTTLKLVFQLRGIRGTGKSDKLHFYDAARWLYEFHPRTLVANTDKVAPVGYFKDLLEMIQRLLEGERETTKRMLQKAEHKRKRAAGKLRNPRKSHSDSDSDSKPIYRRRMFGAGLGGSGYFRRKGAAARAAKKAGTLKPREERIAVSLEKDKREKENAEILRKNKKLTLASRVVEKYNKDPHFKALYDAVAKLFADTLEKDLRALELHKQKAQISLAAKWCPSLDSSYDRQTLLCEAIACRLFPKSSNTEYSQLSQHQYVYRARDKLRKDVLVPLRGALELPEVYMSAKRWGELPYKRVASVAMKTYKELFSKHDPERFQKYLDDVEAGKAKIAAGALLPHEILLGAVQSDGDAAAKQVAELQWKRMVEDLKEKGSLPNSLSVCDVSGSMSGTPMDVCIALGMLTAEISEEPWKGHIITFSKDPKLHAIQGETLKEKYSFTQRMPWGMNTNFQKVFDRILEMAQAINLPPEKMIKRLFVFSDMEFDQATGYNRRQQEVTPWETDYMVITRKFRDAGYGDPPQIVFWNLRDSLSTPVTKDQPGVALVSGFSKNILKMFLDNAGDINPILIMKQAISGKIYEDIKVLD